MIYYAAFVLLISLVIFLDTVLHGRSIPILPAAPSLKVPLPRLSVIVPACNEARGIRAAAISLLEQDYPDMELLLVNDRSTDETGAIMAELARAYPDRVRTVTVERLPAGWLGKNHALWTGSRLATGQWLLFTDADVQYQPSTLRLAVTYAQSEGLDHLTLVPRLISHGYLLSSFVSYFTVAFITGMRPHLANDPTRTSGGTGVGAFNLVRRSAYEAIGTHQAISLRPDDDVRLGMRIKQAGFRQRLADSQGQIQVEWYTSLWEAVRGLEKNLFAGMRYSLPAVIGATALLACNLVLPYLLVWHSGWGPKLLLLAAIGLQLGLMAGVNQRNAVSRLHSAVSLLLLPLMATLFIYAIWRSTWLALRHSGITWRGTFYPLDELKHQTGLEGV